MSAPIEHTHSDEPAQVFTEAMVEDAFADLEQLQVPAPLMLACLSCGHIIRLKEWEGCRAEKKNDHCPIADYARMLR